MLQSCSFEWKVNHKSIFVCDGSYWRNDSLPLLFVSFPEFWHKQHFSGKYFKYPQQQKKIDSIFEVQSDLHLVIILTATVLEPHNHLQTLNHLTKMAYWYSRVWLNGWVFVYQLSGRGFDSCWSHLNFKLWCLFWVRSSLTLRQLKSVDWR